MGLKLTKDYTIVDNFVEENIFEQFKHSTLQNNEVPFFPQNYDSYREDNNFYLSHIIYQNHKPKSSKVFSWLEQFVFPNLQIYILLKSSINLYTRTETQPQPKLERDYNYKFKTAILSLDTCNGYTILEDGTKFDSIQNRMIIFNSYTPYANVTCTDKNYKANLIINYIEPSVMEGLAP
jgi:hypothetical protein